MRDQTVKPVDSPELRAEVAQRLRGIQEALVALTAELRDAMMITSECDGISPDGGPCILSWHAGRHQDAAGHEWLDS